MYPVITIGRQFGSGGSEIGSKLAESLGFEHYDKNIIELASEKSGISKKLFQNADEKHSSFLYSLSVSHYGGMISPAYLNDVITNDKLFIIQSNTIKELAQKGPCVFIGRCADDILKETVPTLNIFIHAPIEDRIKRIMKLYEVEESNAKSLIKKTDKSRASYYNFYASGTWGDSNNYDISINSSLLGVDETVEIIKELVAKKFN